jgi:hypothetical protein
VPFTVKDGIGWPIIRLLGHRLLRQRITVRRRPGGVELNRACRNFLYIKQAWPAETSPAALLNVATKYAGHLCLDLR